MAGHSHAWRSYGVRLHQRVSDLLRSQGVNHAGPGGGNSVPLKNLGAIFGKEGDRLRALYSVLEKEAYPRSYATMPGRCSRRLPGT